MRMFTAVLAAVLAATMLAASPAGANDATSCTRNASLLEWQVDGADGGVVHVRKYTANGSSWIARVSGDSFDVGADDGEYFVRYRVDGQTVNLVCAGGGGESIVCYELGSTLLWGTPDVDLINDRYNIRRVTNNGSSWLRTVPAAAPVSSPRVVANFADGFDSADQYAIRYWFMEGVERVFVDVPCGSWFAGQPTAPGAFTDPCTQTGRVMIIHDLNPDQGKFFLRTGFGVDSRWAMTVNEANFDGGDIIVLAPTAEPLSLRWRSNGSLVETTCNRRFPVE